MHNEVVHSPRPRPSDQLGAVLTYRSARHLGAIKASGGSAEGRFEAVGMQIATQRDYRRRLRAIIIWMEANFPEQHNRCVVELSPEEANDPNRNYFGNTHDFIYENVIVAVVVAFLNGKSKVVVQNYHDALLFGCKMADATLPPRYHSEMRSYLRDIP